jgi:hypothetical protein
MEAEREADVDIADRVERPTFPILMILFEAVKSSKGASWEKAKVAALISFSVQLW